MGCDENKRWEELVAAVNDVFADQGGRMMDPGLAPHDFASKTLQLWLGAPERSAKVQRLVTTDELCEGNLRAIAWDLFARAEAAKEDNADNG